MEDTRTLNGIIIGGRIAKDESVISVFDYCQEGEWPETHKVEAAAPTDSN